MDDWITTSEAAELSGYNEEHIRHLLRQGKLSGRKFGRGWAVERDSVLAYMRRAEETDDSRWGPHEKGGE